MAPTPPFYHALNQFCKFFGVDVVQKEDRPTGQHWTFFIPDTAFMERKYLEWDSPPRVVDQDREEALGHLRWAMDFLEDIRSSMGITGRMIFRKQIKSFDDTQVFLREHDHCNPSIGYHSTPHKGCPLR